MIAGEIRRDETPPFLVKVFYRTGAHHRPDEFNSATLPPYLPIHTWPDCTLDELSSLIAAASPSVLPSPAIGTRLIFRLIYADTRAPRPDMPPRYVPKDLGSVVLGRGGPGAGPEEEEKGGSGTGDGGEGRADGAETTLAEAKFITGDFICCAIMPPDELSGEAVPASSARMGRGMGVGEATGLVGGPPPMAPRQRDYGFSGGFRGRGGFRGGGGGGPRGYYGGGGGGGGGRGRYRDRDESFGRGAGGMPQGEWRRGDRLPDDPPESGWRGR